MNFQTIFKQLIGVLQPFLPWFGQQTLDLAERAVTIPEKDIRALMGAASEADKAEAVRLGRVMADAVSDFAVFVASKGKVVPD